MSPGTAASNAALANAVTNVSSAKVLRLYTVGNSVTDALNFDAFPKLLSSAGYAPTIARQMIPGAPLEWLWGHPNDGFKNDAFGYPTNAFVKYQWDAISLQPFDRHLDTDTKNINDYISLALRNPANKSTRFYIYARWPRMTIKGVGVQYDKNNYGKPNADASKITDYSRLDDWQTTWAKKYTGGWDNSNETADYFETLTKTMRQQRPGVQIDMIPVGHVMSALNAKMQAGQVPGFKTIWDLYNDGIHMGPVGSYVVGCTFYATLTRSSPIGLPSASYGQIDPRVAKIVQQTVFDVVTSQPLSGVKPMK